MLWLLVLCFYGISACVCFFFFFSFFLNLLVCFLLRVRSRKDLSGWDDEEFNFFEELVVWGKNNQNILHERKSISNKN